MKKRIFSLILAVCLFIPMFTTVASAASNDYTTWKQSDPAWNQTEAWPKSQYPNATLRKMSQAGCVVTSIAMLLREYNVVTDSDVNRFNPWIVNEKLKANGCFDSAANMIWSKVGNAYPGFKYAGSKTYSLDTLKSLYNSGYACLVKVSGSGGYYHYIGVRSVNGSSVTIMDPGSNATDLSAYKNRYQIIYFSVSGSGQSQNKSLPTISGANAPGTLQAGKAFSIKGTVSSDTKLTSVTVGVYTAQSGGTMMTGKTASPDATSYSLTKLDAYVLFNKIPAGTYYYRVTATNSAGTAILVNTKFTVQTTAKPPAISGANAPGTLQAGKVFSIKGTVSSDTKLTSVTVGVYTAQSGGTMMTGKTANPNATSYSLTKLDAYVLFNKLPAGTYYYRVTATNSAGTAILVNTKFTVQAAAKPPAISGANAPGTLQAGKAFSIKGTVSSDTKLTSVTVGVYTAQSGGTMITGKTANPNATSYSLTKLDAYVLFNKLPAGTYWYRVTAQNSAGATTLINQKFTVAR